MRIPQELVDVVFAHLVDRDDRQTFRNCALAGRPLLPGARTRLFSRITFDDHHTPFHLEQLPLDDIAPYVKEVVYFGVMTNASVFDVLASLPNLKDVVFHGYYITNPVIPYLSVVSPLNIRGLTLRSVTFEDLSVAFRFLSHFTALTRFSLFGMGWEEAERLGETQLTHQVTGGHVGKMSVQDLKLLLRVSDRSKALLLDDRSPICLCHLRTLQLTLTPSDAVLAPLRDLLNASRGSLTQLRIVPLTIIGEAVTPHNVGLPLRLGHLERIFIHIQRPRSHHILLQWLSHAFSGVEGGNLEQLHITILLRNAFLDRDQAILDVGYWRGLDVALSAKQVPYLRSVHVRLAYNISAASILLLVRDTIRSGCEGLERRQLLSFELDEWRGELVN